MQSIIEKRARADFLQRIVYPYAWGEYNILILPPSFPYGGMENPIYTFATPSLISKVLALKSWL